MNPAARKPTPGPTGVHQALIVVGSLLAMGSAVTSLLTGGTRWTFLATAVGCFMTWLGFTLNARKGQR